MNDHQFMLRALEVSKKALPRCLPNPPVGCILVKNGHIIAEGFTQAIGGHHAEVSAINQYPGSLKGVTAFVTLEPCAFVGRTPSCATILSATKISRVVIAITDLDPRNNGKGISILRRSAMDVDLGIASGEVTKFLSQYLGKS